MLWIEASDEMLEGVGDVFPAFSGIGGLWEVDRLTQEDVNLVGFGPACSRG